MEKKTIFIQESWGHLFYHCEPLLSQPYFLLISSCPPTIFEGYQVYEKRMHLPDRFQHAPKPFPVPLILQGEK